MRNRYLCVMIRLSTASAVFGFFHKNPSLSLSFSLVTAAYKHADGKKIDGKRVVVDVERGRTVKSWKPRRLGT